MSTTTPTRTARGVPRRTFLVRAATGATAALLTVGLAACGSGPAPSGGSGSAGGGEDTLSLGFAQVGAESGWRTANTKSIQDAAAAAGVDLKFSDAQQKQENQIKAIRSFVQQRVDVIAFSPVVTTGWDTVLQEAKRAKIPVILTDRAIDTADPTLYKTFIGSDFVDEGKARRRLAGPAVPGQDRSGLHRPARGNHRLGSGHRPDQGVRRRHRREPEHEGRRLADR